MKIIRTFSTGVLLVLFGTIAPAYAQQDRHEHGREGRPSRGDSASGNSHQDRGRQQQQSYARPQRPQREATDWHQPSQRAQRPQRDEYRSQPQRQQQDYRSYDRSYDPGRRQQQEYRSYDRSYDSAQRSQRDFRSYDRSYDSAQRGRSYDRQNVWQQYRARNWGSEHRDWRDRGGYYGYRIPSNSFGLYFGSSHRFRVRSLPVIVVGGYPRFQYGGYWFGLVDPWPEYWADDWYDRDDMYIDYYGDGYYMCNRRYPGTRIAVSIFID